MSYKLIVWEFNSSRTQTNAANSAAEQVCTSKDGRKRIHYIDTTVLEVDDIPSRHRQVVKTSNCGDLSFGYAHRKPEFLAVTHQVTVDAGGGFVVSKYTLVEGQGDESFKPFAKP